MHIAEAFCYVTIYCYNDCIPFQTHHEEPPKAILALLQPPLIGRTHLYYYDTLNDKKVNIINGIFIFIGLILIQKIILRHIQLIVHAVLVLHKLVMASHLDNLAMVDIHDA